MYNFKRKLVFLLFFQTYLFVAFEFGMMMLSAPRIIAYFGVAGEISPWMIMYAQLAVFVLMLLCSLVCYRKKINQINGQKTYAEGILYFFLGSLILFFSNSIWLFLFGRMVQGLGIALIFLGQAGTITGIHKENAAKLLLWSNAGFASGLMLGPVAGKLLSGLYSGGWQLSVELSALICVFNGLIFVLALDEKNEKRAFAVHERVAAKKKRIAGKINKSILLTKNQFRYIIGNHSNMVLLGEIANLDKKEGGGMKNLLVSLFKAFFDIEKESQVEAAEIAKKASFLTIGRLLYNAGDWIVAAGLASFSFWMQARSCSEATVFAGTVAYDFVASAIFFFLSDMTGCDFTLGQSFRRIIGIFSRNGFWGRIAAGLLFLGVSAKAIVWEGPEVICFLFRKELRTKMHVWSALFGLSVLQGIFGTWLYTTGYGLWEKYGTEVLKSHYILLGVATFIIFVVLVEVLRRMIGWVLALIASLRK